MILTRWLKEHVGHIPNFDDRIDAMIKKMDERNKKDDTFRDDVRELINQLIITLTRSKPLSNMDIELLVECVHKVQSHLDGESK